MKVSRVECEIRENQGVWVGEAKPVWKPEGSVVLEKTESMRHGGCGEGW